MLLAAVLMAVTSTPWAQSTVFHGYTMLDVDELPVTRASSVLAIADGFVPPIEEPLSTRLLLLEAVGDGTGLIVDVETRGYLDDSITGENFRARFETDGEQWVIVALGRQVVCARGPNAGRPAASCP